MKKRCQQYENKEIAQVAGCIYLWVLDGGDGNPFEVEIEPPESGDGIHDLIFSSAAFWPAVEHPEGTYIAVGFTCGTIRILKHGCAMDAASCEHILDIKVDGWGKDHFPINPKLSWSSDGRLLAIGGPTSVAVIEIQRKIEENDTCL